MDGTLLQLAVYVVATFVAAVVAGVSGFAVALIAAAAWLHVLTPLQTAALIVAYAMLVQTYGAWKMRHAARWSRIWPFLAGGAPGTAIGAMVASLGQSCIRACRCRMLLCALCGLRPREAFDRADPRRPRGRHVRRLP
jgi:uncharacterized membrane protein YfcA